VLKPGHEETEENLTNFLESRLQVKTDSLRAQATHLANFGYR
jgi:hypothetical protein